MPQLTAELRLLLACCCWHSRDDDQQHVRSLLDAPIHWQTFLGLAERHRVPAFVYQALRSLSWVVPEGVPPDVLDILAGRFEENRRRVLGLSAELARLARLFQHADIPLLSLKGPALSRHLFGDLAVRHSKDLDLLVGPAQVGRAERLLVENGYRRTHPDFALTPRQARAFSFRYQGFDYHCRARNAAVELHWRLFPNPHLFPDSAVHRMLERRQRVDIGGAPVCLPADDDLFIYLCLHGAVHGWACLKWLCDVAVLLASEQSVDWEGVAGRVVELGVQRPIAQAARLTELLLDVPPPPGPIRALAGRDAGVTPLVGYALRRLLPRGSGGLWRKISRSVDELAYGLRLKPDRRYRGHMLRAAWIASHLWNVWRLPDALFPLYYLARPIASYVPARRDELPLTPGV